MAPLETPFFWAAVAVYAATAGGLVYAVVFRNERLLPWLTGATALGWALETVAIVARSVAQGRVPLSGDYENALGASWFIVAATLLIARRHRPMQVIGIATVPFALVLMGFGAFRDPALTPLAASLRSSWLVVHVFFAWLSFGAYALAMGGGIVYLLKRRNEARAVPNPMYARFPSLDRMDELVFRWVVFGFIADAVMITSGSIWARDLWGSYWSWDPVETWSLVTWVVYGLAIHLRLTRGWRGPRFAALAAIAIVGSIVTFFGVTLVVETSNHLFNVR